MREIKFRAWDGHMMQPVDIIDFYDKTVTTAWHDGSRVLDFDEIVLMQYTGFKDKNGKEIYEGDIIGFTVPSGGNCIERVFYSELGARFMHTYLDRPAKSFWENLDFECKILGNIHENPELLNE